LGDDDDDAKKRRKKQTVRINLPPKPSAAPTIKFPPREMTPGVERSIPACMITSICPSAATARIVIYGRT
jgi:hypothetical protein